MLPKKSSVNSYVDHALATKGRKREIGQDLGEAVKLAKDHGLDIPAANLAIRFISKAQTNPLQARVMYENFLYYLECAEFDKIAPPGMFDREGNVAEEAHQGELETAH